MVLPVSNDSVLPDNLARVEHTVKVALFVRPSKPVCPLVFRTYSSTRPDAGPKHTVDTGAAWSLSVTKQKPLDADQSFTLASSAPVAITVPVKIEFCCFVVKSRWIVSPRQIAIKKKYVEGEKNKQDAR